MENQLDEVFENRFVEIAHELDSNMDCEADAYILGIAIGIARAELLLKEKVESVEEVDEEFEKALPEAFKTFLWDETNPIESAYNIGRYFDTPEKFYYNLMESKKYYYLAANGGNSRACFNLGLNYFLGAEDKKHGFVMEKNYSKAAGLFYFAHGFGSAPEEESKYLYYIAKMYFYGYGVRQNLEIIPQLGFESHKYNSPIYHSGKLDNLVFAAMNIMDGKYDAVPDEYLEEVEYNYSLEGRNEMERSILDSRQAKMEIFLHRRVERCSGSHHEPCPRCGSPMVLRFAEEKGNHRFPAFLGCTSYPDCKGTKDILADIKFE